MNISKFEQRVLHVLAQGGRIIADRKDGPKVREILCVTRDGAILSDCTMKVFDRLRKRRLIHSSGGKPYQISRKGREAVRGQLDNR